ncbi:MAG TPA: hypothetical protein VJZ50_07680 [Candidatus Limnocylindrales bacterium]|jgi:hypothetical protein|nr:hypothetical protein [Candidatus Limnocylindrales bacterium]
MTSRTTPVGVLVVALASLIAVGCSAQTSAVFQAFLDPVAAPPASPSEPVAAASDDVEDAGLATWWPHPDGYAMVLPAGWSGVALDDAEASQLVDAVDVTFPDLAARIDAVLISTHSRVSAIAADASAVGDIGPLLIVLAQPTEDRGAHAVKSLVKEQIAGLPGLSGGPFRDDVTLPTATGVRFEFTIDDPDLGALQVRAFLFRFGSDAYLVSFVAPEEDFEEAEAIFEAIVASLRFGV